MSSANQYLIFRKHYYSWIWRYDYYFKQSVFHAQNIHKFSQTRFKTSWDSSKVRETFGFQVKRFSITWTCSVAMNIVDMGSIIKMIILFLNLMFRSCILQLEMFQRNICVFKMAKFQRFALWIFFTFTKTLFICTVSFLALN